jgi:prepilin-type N-terminal cleavage/methylation domain-containing protein
MQRSNLMGTTFASGYGQRSNGQSMRMIWRGTKGMSAHARATSRANSVETKNVRRRADEGFTLIELLVVILILPIIIGATSLSLISVFSLKSSVSDRLGASADAQVVAASFYSDVQSAAQFTTKPTPTNPAPCGTSTQILGFQWGVTSPTTVVSYEIVPNGTLSSTGVVENNLIRNECTLSGGTLTEINTRTLSFNVPSSISPTVSGQSCPSLLDASASACTPGAAAGAAGWASATGILSITATASEAATNSVSYDQNCPSAGTNFCYSVGAAPRNWEYLGTSGSQPPPPPSGLIPAQFLGTGAGDLLSCPSGNPSIDINGNLVIDSTTSPSTSGKTNVNASNVYYVTSGGTPSNIAGGTVAPISQPANDPLSGLGAPDTTGLPTNPAKKTIGSVTYASPGIYTTTLSGTLTLSSGVYVLQNGLSGNITSGVGGNLLYVTGGTVSPSTMSIWPMTSGTYAGLALWEGPAAAPFDANVIGSGGNGIWQIGGIVYAPSAFFAWTGTPSYWVGALLTKGLSCSGGGNGELNIGFYQSITTFTAPGTASVGSHWNATATPGASPSPVVFSIDNLSGSGVCTLAANGFTVNFVKAGTCLVDADQAQSNQNGSQGGYLEAPTVQQSIQVG